MGRVIINGPPPGNWCLACRAVCGEFPHLGVVDGLCWGHVAGINPAPMPAGLLDTSAPAALARPPRRQERRTR